MPASATAPRLLTVAEVAAMSGLSLDTIRRYADAGRLRAVRTPVGHRRIDPADAAALAESLRIPSETD